jgi:hypothetical protein
MIRKSVQRFSEKIMRKQKAEARSSRFGAKSNFTGTDDGIR